MFSENQLGEYEAKIGRITFVCDEADSETEKKASAIAERYNDALDDIADFMLSEGIEEYFGELQKKDIVNSLGMPIISLDRNTVTFPDNGFDDMLIIEFHFEGILENYSDLDIDG